jgi:hypothetical protein
LVGRSCWSAAPIGDRRRPGSSRSIEVRPRRRTLSQHPLRVRRHQTSPREATRLRGGEPQSREHRPARLCRRPRDRSTKQNRSSGQVRDHRADAPRDRRAPCGEPKAPRDFLFRSRRGNERCLSTRQYARLLSGWIASIGLELTLFGTHSLRRPNATLICRRTVNPPCGSAAPSHQGGEHGQIAPHRGRCARDRRADRRLNTGAERSRSAHT